MQKIGKYVWHFHRRCQKIIMGVRRGRPEIVGIKGKDRNPIRKLRKWGWHQRRIGRCVAFTDLSVKWDNNVCKNCLTQNHLCKRPSYLPWIYLKIELLAWSSCSGLCQGHKRDAFQPSQTGTHTVLASLSNHYASSFLSFYNPITESTGSHHSARRTARLQGPCRIVCTTVGPVPLASWCPRRTPDLDNHDSETQSSLLMVTKGQMN